MKKNEWRITITVFHDGKAAGKERTIETAMPEKYLVWTVEDMIEDIYWSEWGKDANV